MWMPPGSFWTQPKGEVHITAAKGKTNIAFIEIDRGPYLVLPKSKAFDSGERPVNVDRSNIVWLDLPGSQTSANNPKVAYLWGAPHTKEMQGVYIKLPKGYSGKIKSLGETFQAVIISGEPNYRLKGDDKPLTLKPGSHFSSKGDFSHEISSSKNLETVIYIRTNGSFGIEQ